MWALVLGLVLFLLPHSVRFLAPQRRDQWIAQWGVNGWKMRYSLVTVVGLVVLIWGYGQARSGGVQIWLPPVAMKHANSLFTLVAFVLIGASNVPKNHITQWVRHPLTLAVKVWVLGHLLAVGSLAGMVLFGAFLVWSVLVFKGARQRDRAMGATTAPGHWPRTALAIGLGVALWAVFAFWAHAALIGVRVLG